MADKASEQSIMDKSMRSVFVGNIPYEATEEKLKEIFSEVGPVLSLKLVFDRESGKPKGFGFCEYKDQETALSAMRNLNGYEIGGRTLRVDNACTEKSRMEMQQLLQGPQVENPYGEPCDPTQAPELITKTVASLPPEQMFELMKQMKLCIQNNPMEARQMLLLNPQLAYALLQAMVVMRIIDTQSAVNMLFKANTMPPVLGTNHAQANSAANSNGPPSSMSMSAMQNTSPVQPTGTHGMNAPPSLMSSNFNLLSQQIDMDMRNSNMDMRSSNMDMRNNSMDMRSGSMESRGIDPRMARSMEQDMRNMPNPVPPPNIDPRTQRLIGGPSMQTPPQVAPVPPPTLPQFPSDPRQRPMDPRLRNAGPPLNMAASAAAVASQQQTAAQRLASNAMGIPNDASDQEKAALIMQVLQLSDEQIAQLPPEQRTSILVLKEQIAKSTQR